MYRRPKFLEILIDIRQQMALEADYDVDLFAERVRAGTAPVVEIVDKPSAIGDVKPVKTKARSSTQTKVKLGK